MALWRLCTRGDLAQIRWNPEPSDDTRRAQAALERVLVDERSPFRYERRVEGTKLPRNLVWRPYRLTQRDDLLAVAVVRLSKAWNCLEIDAFEARDAAGYSRDEPLRALALFVLSEAVRSGGAFALRFTRSVAGGALPRSLVGLAEKCDVRLQHVREGYVDDAECRRLYLALSRFPSDVVGVIRRLHRLGRVRAENACYLAHQGAWSSDELAALFQLSERPELVLRGEVYPEARHLYAAAVHPARHAVMVGMLGRALRRAASETDPVPDTVFASRSFDGAGVIQTSTGARIPLSLPWSEDPVTLEATHSLVTLVRATDPRSVVGGLSDDIALARKHQQPGVTVAVAAPFDMYDLARSVRDAWCDSLRSADVVPLVSPLSLTALEGEVQRRMRFARFLGN